MADRQFTVGERYRLQIWEERSSASHSHEFAWLDEAWLNLPEHLADQYPSPQHLRKCALIQAGYYNEEVMRGPLVVVRSAKSQSRRAMNKAEFQASKTAIMDIIAAMLGTSRDALGRAVA